MNKWHKFYMAVTHEAAKLSYCNKRQVGCIIVKDKRIISYGYNGTLPGDDNKCEDEYGITKDTVIHAEQNALIKVASSNDSTVGAIMYCTISPCLQCSKLIIASGISKFIYEDVNKNTLGLLSSHGVEVWQLKDGVLV